MAAFHTKRLIINFLIPIFNFHSHCSSLVLSLCSSFVLLALVSCRPCLFSVQRLAFELSAIS